MSTALALWRKDLRAMRNIGRILRRESRFKVGFILLFALGLVAGLFLIFLRGFHFLGTMGGTGFMIIRYLFSFFFFALGIMLMLSSIVTTYSTTFRSREVPFMLTGPFTTRTIVTYKFYEACLLSSWAFFFIIIPFVLAYARHEHYSPLFFLWTLFFSLPFLVLCSGLGAAASLLFVRWFPRPRWARYALAAGGIAAVVLLFLRYQPTQALSSTSFILSRVVPGLQVAAMPMTPNWWAAEGIMSLTRGQYLRGFMLWSVLASSALVVAIAVQVAGEATFAASWQKLIDTAGRARRRAVMLPGASWFVGLFCGRQARGMVLKDIRTFLRDPMQWSQALIFFGLLGLYFASLRTFRYNYLPPEWRNFIVFLNIFSVASVLCSLASRFVFPQLSLEGHGFWIVGLSPVSKGRILLTKFATAFAAMLAVSMGLILLSSHMLQVELLLKLVAVGIAGIIALAVCAMSTGLGAVFMDLKQTNPMAIVSGFGGTVNLVLSLGYMFAVILPFGFIFHLFYHDRLTAFMLHRALGLAVLWTAVLTLLAVAIPLYAGYRSLRDRDY